MTDDPTPYDEDSAWDLVTMLGAAFARWSSNQGRMTITADIEWAGEFNPRPHRTTTFWAHDPLQLAVVRAATDAALAARASAAAVFARPAPLSTTAQINFLRRTRGGRATWSDHGLTVTERTVQRWLAGTQHPNKANLQRLRTASEDHHAARVNAAQARSEAASLEAAYALSDELNEPVRFFNVSDLYFTN